VELASLDEVCGQADYLTLHLPSTPETRHLFDDDRFAPVGEVDEHETAATDITRFGERNGQRERGGNGGVYRIAAPAHCPPL